ADAGLRQRDRVAGQLDEVVLRPRPADDVLEVDDRRHRVVRGAAQHVEPRAESVGDRLRRRYQGVEVIERRAEVDEGGVRLPDDPGQLVDRRRQRELLAGERVHRQVQVVDELGDRRGALREGAGQRRAVDQQALELRRVAGELLEDAAGRREQRIQVLEALVGLLRGALVADVEALDDVLEVLDRLRRQRVEDLVEIDLRGGGGERDLAAVGDVRGGRVRRRQRQLDLASGDRRQRG